MRDVELFPHPSGGSGDAGGRIVRRAAFAAAGGDLWRGVCRGAGSR